MGPRKVWLCLTVLCMVVVSSSGCIGLIPAREALETIRNKPKFESVDERVTLNHTFTTIVPIEYHDEKRFNVDEDVSMISIYFSVTWAWEDQTTFLPDDSRYVEVRLIDSEGSEVYSYRTSNGSRPQEEHKLPPFESGEWVLEVDARGYGQELINFGDNDNFRVIVTIERSCVEYPTEKGCQFN